MRRAGIAGAAAVVLALLLLLGFHRLGPVPPLGPFLDPIHGIWGVAPQARLPASATAEIPGLRDSVRVLYDIRGVPHIFARNTLDLARALGYVVARDRLFQLELQARDAAGTLSGLLGREPLPEDRFMRRLGLAASGDRAFAALPRGSRERALLEAYADGVNAWIGRLGAADLPFEYHLLGAWPQPWKPVYSDFIVRLMGLTLSYSDMDRAKLRAAARVGFAAADALFPAASPIQEPIQPGPGPYPRFDIAALPPPGPPDTAAADLAEGLDSAGVGRLAWRAPDHGLLAPGLELPLGRTAVPSPGEPVLGSNDWAVAPRRTASGYALLEGDPHLHLTLPSIWYEVQLVVPDSVDVYGVTIPGLPMVVLGFNRDIAWSFTNTGADVMDYYRETVDDPDHPTRYRVDGQWRDITQRIEVYRDPQQHVVAVDTFLSTFRGPLVATPVGRLSLHWTVLQTPSTAASFWDAARAHTVQEFLGAMAPFDAPAQNMIVADRQGHIALRSTGWFPIRPGDGRGDTIRAGDTTADDWIGRWPVDRYPQGIDPAQGYLASANQQPIDPRQDSSYLGVDWPAPWRAIDINQLLRADSAVTPDAMRRFQTDPASSEVAVFLPAFLAAATRRQAAGDSGQVLAAAARLLRAWDGRYTRDNTGGVLFDMAMDQLQRRTWDELRPPASGTASRDRAPLPGEAVLADLLADSASAWWDDRSTPGVVEHRDDILAASLGAAYREAVRRYGPPDAGGWRWDRVQHANIYHLLGLPGLSALGLAVQGGPGTLNPIAGSGTHGPSWRMVVQLGPQVHAWGVLPGGESGNPASRFYADRVGEWAAGRLDPLPFPRGPAELDAVAGSLLLRPGG
jgi:penicillin G amidase